MLQIFQGCGELFHSSKELKRYFERAHGHGPEILFIYYLLIFLTTCYKYFRDIFNIF